MSKRWTLKYGSAAVFIAVAIIAVALLANPTFLPKPVSATATFAVMLTDPPTVPDGTSLLNLTYADVLLHIAYPNGTVEWLSVNASGTVNLFSLINMSQTLASITIPLGSYVDKIQFNIADVTAVINATTYDVTVLSDKLIINVKNSCVNQTLSGVLLDFNPTLVQIQAVDADGTLVDYYVLVPSATATIVTDLSEEHTKVGTIIKIGQNHKEKLKHVEEEASSNVKITSASLIVSGDAFQLFVELKNEGDAAFRVFGLTMHGEFNTAQTRQTNKHNQDDTELIEKIHPRTIPFKLDGSTLIPLLGNEEEDDDEDDDMDENGKFSSYTLEPGESVTLRFADVITLKHGNDNAKVLLTVVKPVVGESYTLKLMGEGSQTFTVTATEVAPTP